MEDQIIQTMKELGFTANEGRAYIALLKQNPATGYELSSRSGVPRSAIYGLLRRLEGLGLVMQVEEKPTKYIPLPPDKLFDMLDSRFQRLLGGLKDSLLRLRREEDTGAFWRIRGYQQIMERAGDLIDQAQECIYISGWSREVELLGSRLKEAKERGVVNIFFSFCPLPEELGQVYSYDLPPERLEKFWTHKMIVVIDQNQVLMGGARQKEEQTTAVLSMDPDIVEIATNNIAMDITLFGWRLGRDVSEAMIEMLRDRLGELDELLTTYHPSLA